MDKISPLKLTVCNSDLLLDSGDFAIEELSVLLNNSMCYIRNIIDVYHTYSHSEEQCMKQLRVLFDINEIRRSGMIDFKAHAALIKRHGIPLTPSEIELNCLILHGFQPRELSMIYGHSNPNSIHVRMHRLKQKLAAHRNSAAKEDPEG